MVSFFEQTSRYYLIQVKYLEIDNEIIDHRLKNSRNFFLRIRFFFLRTLLYIEDKVAGNP